MNRIDSTFARLRSLGEKALVGFITAGDPHRESSLEIIRGMIDGGIDILEMGVPFSDPTADGPVIQRSSARALGRGMNLEKVLEMTAEIRGFSQVPIIIFSYYNPILKMGGDRFYQNAVTAGADGVLAVDLPPEESPELTDLWPGDKLFLIRLIAPTSPRKRAESILESARGFVYVVSMTGVTGSGKPDPEQLKDFVTIIRGRNTIPLCVGFGINNPGQVREICAFADGVIVGSAFERAIEKAKDIPDAIRRVRQLATLLKEGTRIKK